MSNLRRVFLLTVFHLSKVIPTEISCNHEGLVNCTCSLLQRNDIFVDCSNGNIGISAACEICRSIENVTKLDVSFNNLSTIPESCFKYCNEVSWLSLRSNEIRRLEKNTFQRMIQLQHLILDGNFLVTEEGNITTPEAFDSLTNLKSLSLKENYSGQNKTGPYRYLGNVSNRTFAELQKLFLDGLPYGLFGQNFQNYKKLIHLDLSGINHTCKIIGLTNETFRNVMYVTNLNLTTCHISTIEAGTFEPLTRLQSLNLSHNMELGFVTLRNVSFGLQNTSIEVLDYSKVYKTFGVTNELKRCDLWYLNNTNLKEIRLNSNRMQGIEVDGMHLVPRSLKVIWAQNNPLDYGPYLFQTGCLSNLEVLEISKKPFGPNLDNYNNELYVKEKQNVDHGTEECKVSNSSKRKNCPFLDGQKLGENISISASLKRVTMSKSQLYLKLPDYKGKLKFKNSVQYIDLSSNILYSWEGRFLPFTNLQVLNMSNNFCSNVTETFFNNTPNLEILDVSKNKLGFVLARDTEGSIFQPLPRLKYLNLAQNDIETLPQKVFVHLRYLETLNISYNRIHKINFYFSHMNELSNLDVRQNKIYFLPVSLLQQMDNNSKRNGTNISIDMSKNLIHLSCKHLKFLNWMSDHTKCFKNIEKYQFKEKDGTITFFPKFRPALEKLQKKCRSYTPIYIVSAISVTTFVAILTGGFIYRFRWRLRYFYYLARAKYTGYLPLHDSESEIFQYDAFVSYANEDADFVKNEMVGKLEEEYGLHLCLHERDFTPGRYIAENILQAIKNSRKTIIVLSKSFVTSKWCRYEFNMARMEGVYSRGGENILFVIMYEDVNMAVLSPEMVECLKTESFLKYHYDESEMRFFWETLKQGLLGRGQ